MKIKLIPIPVVKSPKNKYIIDVWFMHGDADAYTSEIYACKNESAFLRVMESFKNKPDCRTCNQYDWCTTTFGEGFTPYDITCDSYLADVSTLTGYYYDENGIKFEAELI